MRWRLGVVVWTGRWVVGTPNGGEMHDSGMGIL